jgi:hypothetical protein
MLGEAMYTYGKMRDAEKERKTAEIDYQKFSQYFQANPKAKEALDARRTKVERNLSAARSDYVRAARGAETLLRDLKYASPAPSRPPLGDEIVRQMMEREIREHQLITQRDLNQDLHEVQKLQEVKWRELIRKETRPFALRIDVDRLIGQVGGIDARQRQASVSSEGSRDVDHLVLSSKKEVEQVRSDFESRISGYEQEISELKQQLSALQLQANTRQPIRPPKSSGAKPQDLEEVTLESIRVTVRWNRLLKKHKRSLMTSTSRYMKCRFDSILYLKASGFSTGE